MGIELPGGDDGDVETVIFQVMIQDVDIVDDPDLHMAAIHPVVGKTSGGFQDGPTCSRVAIVDLDIETGTLRRPAILLPEGEIYRKVGTYNVKPPRGKRRAGPWDRVDREEPKGFERVRTPTARDDPFIKVSTFGAVLSTIGFVEGPACLGHRAPWGFHGDQLLVLPMAGELDNAFYIREARSLFFYYFTPSEAAASPVFSALSQDIVCHETTHALVDGIAPDLYNSASPDGAAIHEAVADVTAGLVSLANRELLAESVERTRVTREALLGGSSRFSRIAEQFGRWRGHGTELRDLHNSKTLDPEAPASNQVDPSSPHSLSEVVSGALYETLLSAADSITAIPQTQKHGDNADDVRSSLMRPLQARIGSLIYKGLDWLPPGDVGLADCIRSILAADQWHRPYEVAERRALASAAVSRCIATPDELRWQTPNDKVKGDFAFTALANKTRAAKSFVTANRGLFGLPTMQAFIVRVSPVVSPDVEVGHWLRDKGFHVDLDRPDPANRLDDAEVLLIKVGWWEAEPNDLGEEFASTRERIVGSTMAVNREGRVLVILRGGQGEDQAARRSHYLRRLAARGALLPPSRSLGPDGERLDGFLYASGLPITRIEGGFHALHLADSTA